MDKYGLEGRTHRFDSKAKHFPQHRNPIAADGDSAFSLIVNNYHGLIRQAFE
jgi:hypothetical protein